MKKIISSKQKRENFIREIQILSKIDHPNIITIYDYEIKQTEINIIMELCDQNLLNFLQNSVYPLARQNVKTVTKMILQGLEELHSRGILHRDIKPSNVLISSNGVIKIADFGLAIPLSDKVDGEFPIEGFTT